MKHRHALTTLALALAASCAAPAHATDKALTADGSWQQFSVDSFAAAPSYGLGWIDDTDGSALAFTFTIAPGSTATLTVVDGAFGGDTFSVTNFGSALGSTSAVALAEYSSATDLGYDFDAALLNASFSHGVFALAAGSYRIGGLLVQSVLLDGQRLDSTAGAVRLSVSAVPEPSTFALLLAGLGVMGLLARRHNR